MINAVKKRLDRKGFTLAEGLVTVAIILILAGVTFVSVVQYQKNLRLMEMDGTAKGGIALAIQSELGIPVKYIGTGEKAKDLRRFDAKEYVDSIFAD